MGDLAAVLFLIRNCMDVDMQSMDDSYWDCEGDLIERAVILYFLCMFFLSRSHVATSYRLL